MCCPRTPLGLPEKVQAAFQSPKTVQKQPAHSKQAVAAQIFRPKVKPYPAPSPVGESKTTAPLSDDRSIITDNRLKTYNSTTYYYDVGNRRVVYTTGWEK